MPLSAHFPSVLFIFLVKPLNAVFVESLGLQPFPHPGYRDIINEASDPIFSREHKQNKNQETCQRCSHFPEYSKWKPDNY